MKDKVKRRRILNQRKRKNLFEKYFSENDPENLILEREKQKLELQQIEYDKLSIMKMKLQLMKRKTKELNKDFLLNKRKDYTSTQEFINKYKEIKSKRKAILNKEINNFKIAKNIYREKYETFSFKIKRWFYGMGKEFIRIRWSTKKMVLINFFVVIGISTFLALIFLLIDFIFSVL